MERGQIKAIIDTKYASINNKEDILEDVREIFDASEATIDMMFNRDDYNYEDDGLGSFINRF